MLAVSNIPGFSLKKGILMSNNEILFYRNIKGMTNLISMRMDLDHVFDDDLK